MAAPVYMKCQFCKLTDFTSAYKIIPHVYFGHRKKISKYVKEHGEIKLECPVLPCNSCDFHIAAPIEQGLIFLATINVTKYYSTINILMAISNKCRREGGKYCHHDFGSWFLGVLMNTIGSCSVVDY